MVAPPPIGEPVQVGCTGAGGGFPEIAAEVLRRLDVAPGLAALVREAVADALAGRRPR